MEFEEENHRSKVFVKSKRNDCDYLLGHKKLVFSRTVLCSEQNENLIAEI